MHNVLESYALSDLFSLLCQVSVITSCFLKDWVFIMCISPVTDPSHGIAHFKVEMDFFFVKSRPMFMWSSECLVYR